MFVLEVLKIAQIYSLYQNLKQKYILITEKKQANKAAEALRGLIYESRLGLQNALLKAVLKIENNV